MPSRLEESTKTARNIAVGCIVLVVVVLLLNFISNLLKKPPEPYNPYPKTADESFGTLEETTFESLELSPESDPDYRIEIAGNELPDKPTIVDVYKTRTPYQSLTAQDDAIAVAKTYGFTSEPKVISSTELRWSYGTKMITINKLYKTIKLTTKYKKTDRENLTNEILPDTEPYVQAAHRHFERAGLLPADYVSRGNATVTYLKLNRQFEFELASSSQEANFVRVDMFRQTELVGVNIPEGSSDEYREELSAMRLFAPVKTDNPARGALYVVLGGTGGNRDLYELNYTEWEIEDVSYYKLLPLEEAWNEVKNDEGYIKLLHDDTKSPFETYEPLHIETFFLTNVEIIYYQALEYPKYIVPIYEFSGLAKESEDDHPNTEFIIYYPALKNIK